MHLLFSHDYPFLGFAGGLDRQESACSARDLGSISGSRRSPGVGNGYPLQYSCLENSMDKGAYWATVHGICPWGHKETDTTEQPTLSLFIVDKQCRVI